MAIDDNTDDNQSDVAVEEVSKNGEASSGRLFMKKFLLFKNMFGSNQKQPIIPIIITGGGNNPTNTAPTSTITSTGTVPSGTGTITTSPVTTPAANAPAPAPVQRVQLIARGSYDNNDQDEEQSVAVDEQTLAAALGAGAEEYVVTDQEIKGTSDAKANQGPARINLRRRGGNNGQVVSVRIPPKYRGYFKNGQRVILNNGNRPAKRRVIKKRVIRNRNRKNINKRRRVNV